MNEISNASIGIQCEAELLQRAAVWCEAAERPQDITLEQAAETGFGSKCARLSAVIRERIA
ncbi:MAG TPA: hypothetical protein DD433_04955 [Ruminococcaceae bacterium]|nr:hypothetical protein [Oscillospiraceae bacterium]